MIETSEKTHKIEQKGQNSAAETLQRYQRARENINKRADALKGKDEQRRRRLLKAADAMRGSGLTLAQIRRKAICAEIDLLVDEMKHKGKAARR